MHPLKKRNIFQKKYAYVKIWLLYIWTTPTFDLPKEQNIFQMTRPTLKCTTLGKFGLSESGLMLFCPVSRLHSFPNDLRVRHYSSVNWTPTKEEDGLRRDKTRKGNLNKKVLKLTIAMFGQLQKSIVFVWVNCKWRRQQVANSGSTDITTKIEAFFMPPKNCDTIREDLNWKKTFSFGHCPNNGGGGLPMPEFFGPLFRSAFLVNKKSLFLQKCQCIELLTVF